MSPAALAQRWDARFPGCPPLGYELRVAFPDRWVRFHSLPDRLRARHAAWLSGHPAGV